MSRFKAIKDAMSRTGRPEVTQEEGMGIGDRILDVLDRPGRATRAAIGAAQDDKPILDALTAQLGSNPPQAPTGHQIAEKFGEQHDVQNPYALAGLATLAEMADPLSFIPGGQIGKAGKIAKMVKKGKPAATYHDVAKKAGKGVTYKPTAQELAEAKALKNPGKVTVKPTAEDLARERNVKRAKKEVTPRKNVSELPETKLQRSAEQIWGKEEADRLLQDFPSARESLKRLLVPKKEME